MFKLIAEWIEVLPKMVVIFPSINSSKRRKIFQTKKKSYYCYYYKQLSTFKIMIPLSTLQTA